MDQRTVKTDLVQMIDDITEQADISSTNMILICYLCFFWLFFAREMLI